MLDYFEKHLCKSQPIPLGPTLLTPVREKREKYRLELTVRAKMAVQQTDKKYLISEDDPIHLVFDPAGSTVSIQGSIAFRNECGNDLAQCDVFSLFIHKG